MKNNLTAMKTCYAYSKNKNYYKSKTCHSYLKLRNNKTTIRVVNFLEIFIRSILKIFWIEINRDSLADSGKSTSRVAFKKIQNRVKNRTPIKTEHLVTLLLLVIAIV